MTAPMDPREGLPPTKEDFAHWSRVWHDTCETIMTLLALPGNGSPQEMLAQVQAYVGRAAPAPAPETERLMQWIASLLTKLRSWRQPLLPKHRGSPSRRHRRMGPIFLSGHIGLTDNRPRCIGVI